MNETKQLTIGDIQNQVVNGEFNRQHESLVRLGKDGKIIEDRIIKTDESYDIYNKKQRDAFKAKMERENALKDHIDKNEGGEFVHFMFRYTESAFEKLELRCGGNKANIHIIRFIKLIVHLNFNNNLYDEDRNRIKKGNLGKIWDTKNNRKSVYETFEILKDEGFISETKEGYIVINEDIAKKGKVKDTIKSSGEDNIAFTRLLSSNIKDMYLKTDAKNRKQLANLFKIIPYINFRFNIFCENPLETDENEIIPLSWSELARKCGYDEKKHVSKFKKDLFNLSIGEHDVIGQFTSKSGYKIVINPKIYYGGSNIEDVKALYALFKMPIA